MTGPVLHEKYLPFTREQLQDHFAPVGKAQNGRHLRHFEESVENLNAHLAAAPVKKPSPAEVRRGRQLEKDERFWIVSALMSLYHRPRGPAARARKFARLMERADLDPPADFTDWESALAGSLKLYFEVSLPSPDAYRTWLVGHLKERVLFPYVSEAATKASRSKRSVKAPRSAGPTKAPRLEGATKADAMLVAPDTGVAIIFEAKVLSDVSTHVTFDVCRNQIARNIDVMLEKPKGSGASPLDKRLPERTSFVLITPDLFRSRETGLRGSRLYGWLMDEYTKQNKKLLAQHLGHRTAKELVGVPTRIGWASWEDFNTVMPRACSWLST